MSPEVTLASIVDAARLLPGFGRGGLYLVEADGLRLAGEWGSAEGLSAHMPVGDGLVGRAAAAGQVLVAHGEGGTTVALPLRTAAAVVGVLWLEAPDVPDLDPAAAGVLPAFADLAAAALDATRRLEAAERLAQDRARALEALRHAQDRLVRSERLQALGEMASGVAHDFNNLLAVILGRVQLMLMRTDDPEIRRGLGIVETVASEAAQTVRRIQEFTRTRRRGAWGPVSLTQVIGEAVEVTRRRWRDEAQGRGVTYEVTTSLPDTPRINGEATELRELFVGLVENALDAMPEGGSLHVALRADDGAVVLTVEDSGHGMVADVRGRVFEPFFTTRGPDRAGLGLSVAYGIIRRHDGQIEVASVEGRGTTFTITLPSAAEPAAAAAGPSPGVPGARAAGPVRVLLVEDEAPVRDVLVELLRVVGHTVLTAADGPTGLALLEREGPVDIALIDLGLPGMSGWDVAERIRGTCPDTPVVLITGWGDQLDPATVEARGIRQVLAKPFRTEQVLQVIADVARPATARP